MKIARFEHGGKVRYGIVEGESLVECRIPFRADKGAKRLFDNHGTPAFPYGPPQGGGGGAQLPRPRKRDGGTPPEDPIIFIKPSTSVIGPGDDIVMPKSSTRIDYEGELAVIIGKRAKDVPVAEAKA